jgi:hypothetical protein
MAEVLKSAIVLHFMAKANQPLKRVCRFTGFQKDGIEQLENGMVVIILKS